MKLKDLKKNKQYFYSQDTGEGTWSGVVKLTSKKLTHQRVAGFDGKNTIEGEPIHEIKNTAGWFSTTLVLDPECFVAEIKGGFTKENYPEYWL